MQLKTYYIYEKNMLHEKYVTSSKLAKGKKRFTTSNKSRVLDVEERFFFKKNLIKFSLFILF
jgi:hypothetical protein